MKTYRILYAEDVPHYAIVEIQATTDDEANRIAKAKVTGDLDFEDPDWNNPILRRIVHVEDESGNIIANDIPLDGYVLTSQSPRNCHPPAPLVKSADINTDSR